MNRNQPTHTWESGEGITSVGVHVPGQRHSGLKMTKAHLPGQSSTFSPAQLAEVDQQAADMLKAGPGEVSRTGTGGEYVYTAPDRG